MPLENTPEQYADIDKIADDLKAENAVFLMAVKRIGAKNIAVTTYATGEELISILVNMGKSEPILKRAIKMAAVHLLSE